MFSEKNLINGLYTDYYELTMAQGFFKENRHTEPAVFDYFFRRCPFGGSYLVFAGLETLDALIKQFRFTKSETNWLKEQGFDTDFLNWLESTPLEVSFEAPPEGTLVFPFEPVMQVKGPVAQCLLLETLILNIINFESLIATKAARMKSVMKSGQKLIDFGLRRAHGLSGLHASRAAFIGGCDSSSNTMSSLVHNHPSGGTHAHAWVQSFESEYDAFITYATHYPDSCVLLVDTYDTIRSGVPNAIRAAREMESRGKRLRGIRLDSGDFTEMIPEARRLLNEAGLDYVKIVISDNIDEHKIEELNSKNIPADVFGVGTRLITAKDDPALNGVFKLSTISGRPLIKVSDDEAKITLPGPKRVFRAERNGRFMHDVICCEHEKSPENDGALLQPLRTLIFGNSGELQKETLDKIKQRAQKQLAKLEPALLRLVSGDREYKVILSEELKTLRKNMIRSHGSKS